MNRCRIVVLVSFLTLAFHSGLGRARGRGGRCRATADAFITQDVRLRCDAMERDDDRLQVTCESLRALPIGK